MLGRRERRALACLISLTVPACDTLPTAHLHTGDEVALVQANRGHELVVQKGDAVARVRLVGIYTFDPRVPERRAIATLAQRAVAEVERAATGPQRVRLVMDERDPRGRFIAYSSGPAGDLGAVLLRSGDAAVYTEYPFDAQDVYFTAEAEARAARRGLWAVPAAVQRIRALRQTWSAVHARKIGHSPRDPLLGGAP